MEKRVVTVLLASLWVLSASAEMLLGENILKDEVPRSESYDHAAVHGGVLVDSNEKLSFVERYSAGESGPAIVAVASYVDSAVTLSNFGHLHVTTFSGFKDDTQMRAAGFLEGWLSADRIFDHYVNMMDFFNLSSPAVGEWLDLQDRWAWGQAKKKGKREAIWGVAKLVMSQFNGLVEGYNARVAAGGGLKARHLSRTQLLFIQATGDVFDLAPALEVEKQPAWHTMEPHTLETSLYATSKCSALIKVTPDLSDILMSHSTWFSYSSMSRVYKHWSFSLSNKHHKLRRASFSSYPGQLSSCDDFYMLDTGLVVLETTNDIFNTTLYSLLTPNTLLSWHRVRIASAMATTGEEWTKVVGIYNSGTYNNQYMVIDIKRFQPRKALQPGLLWVVEQIPGLVVSADKTDTLQFGYWPSYNVPYFHKIYKASGYEDFVKAQAARGPAYVDAVSGMDYQLAPRAKIFRRDVGSVNDMKSFKDLMRSNKWPHDPFSRGSSFGAICPRGDIDHKRPMAYGCTDTKVTNFKLAKQLLAEVISGPTAYGHPPFAWSKSGNLSKASHVGEPDKFNYRFEFMRPLKFLSDA